MIVLLATGLYMWWPTDAASKAGFLKLRVGSGSRVFMRDLHANLGGGLSIVLLLFVLSGLAWAGIWGAKMVQGWNTFPTYYTWGDKPSSTDKPADGHHHGHHDHSKQNHADLNHGSEEEFPWNLELAEVPQSEDHGSHHSGDNGDKSTALLDSSVSINSIVERAKQLGFTQFKVFMPRGELGVYTVAANSMAGDVIDPRQDRTTHFDQYSGRILMDVTWQDYSIVAKLMAAGVSLHQGDLSVVNKLLNAFFCIAFIAISITGVVMWWQRRPKTTKRLGVPARFESEGVWKVGVVTIALISVLFPLAGFAIVLTLVIDWLVVRRSDKLAAYLS